MVFPFFPIPYHRVYVASCFFWPRIGHLEIGLICAIVLTLSSEDTWQELAVRYIALQSIDTMQTSGSP